MLTFSGKINEKTGHNIVKIHWVKIRGYYHITPKEFFDRPLVSIIALIIDL